jgi:hypothetical protein
LESIGVRIAGLTQWYDVDSELLGQTPLPPRGITVLALRRR